MEFSNAHTVASEFTESIKTKAHTDNFVGIRVYTNDALITIQTFSKRYFSRCGLREKYLRSDCNLTLDEARDLRDKLNLIIERLESKKA